MKKLKILFAIATPVLVATSLIATGYATWYFTTNEGPSVKGTGTVDPEVAMGNYTVKFQSTTNGSNYTDVLSVYLSNTEATIPDYTIHLDQPYQGDVNDKYRHDKYGNLYTTTTGVTKGEGGIWYSVKVKGTDTAFSRITVTYNGNTSSASSNLPTYYATASITTKIGETEVDKDTATYIKASNETSITDTRTNGFSAAGIVVAQVDLDIVLTTFTGETASGSTYYPTGTDSVDETVRENMSKYFEKNTLTQTFSFDVSTKSSSTGGN